MGSSIKTGLNSSLATLESSLKKTMESEQRQKAMQIQKEVWDQHQHQQQLKAAITPTSHAFNEEELSNSAITSLRAKEEEIEKRKIEVTKKVQAHLSRVEDEARRLDQIRKELEGLGDPTKREVAEIRKKIEAVDRELKPLKQTCDRKEKEYKDAVESFNAKSKLKIELITSLMELVTESEKLRIKKLDELNKHIEAMH